MKKELKIKEKYYYARPGAPFDDKEAQELGEYLEKKQLRTTKQMLEDAKNPKSILHKYLEWDDKKAAYHYRIQQLSTLIGYLEVEIVYEEGKSVMYEKASEFIYTKKGEKIWVPVEEGMKDENFKTQVIIKGWKILRRFRERFILYQVFSPVFDAIEEVEQELKAKKLIGE